MQQLCAPKAYRLDTKQPKRVMIPLMTNLRAIWTSRALLPTGALLLVLIGARLLALRAAGMPASTLFTGEALVAFLAATVACIAWAATLRPGEPAARVWLGWALLADLAGLWVLVLGAWSGHVLPAAKLYVLLAAWLALWTAASALLRRWGPGVAVAFPATLATVLLTMPASCAAVYRALPPAGLAGLPRETMIRGLHATSPTLGLFDALRTPESPFSWPPPLMYHLSPLNQDLPLGPLPAWYWQAAGFAAAAALLALVNAKCEMRIER